MNFTTLRRFRDMYRYMRRAEYPNPRWYSALVAFQFAMKS